MDFIHEFRVRKLNLYVVTEYFDGDTTSRCKEIVGPSSLADANRLAEVMCQMHPGSRASLMEPFPENYVIITDPVEMAQYMADKAGREAVATAIEEPPTSLSFAAWMQIWHNDNSPARQWPEDEWAAHYIYNDPKRQVVANPAFATGDS